MKLLLRIIPNVLAIIGIVMLYMQYDRYRYRNNFYKNIRRNNNYNQHGNINWKAKYLTKSVKKSKKNDDKAILCLNSSQISNQGVFSKRDIPCNSIIGIGIENVKNLFGINFEITNLGTKINHCAKDTNVFLEIDQEKGDVYFIVTMKNISANTELFLNYRTLPYFIYDASWHFKDC